MRKHNKVETLSIRVPNEDIMDIKAVAWAIGDGTTMSDVVRLAMDQAIETASTQHPQGRVGLLADYRQAQIAELEAQLAVKRAQLPNSSSV